jgi:hypothetical protein
MSIIHTISGYRPDLLLSSLRHVDYTQISEQTELRHAAYRSAGHGVLLCTFFEVEPSNHTEKGQVTVDLRLDYFKVNLP